MKLPEKKERELYSEVAEEIFQARIKIWQMRNNLKISIHEIDDIMFKLGQTAPQKALDVFKPKP